jgi:hypothetical protein
MTRHSTKTVFRPSSDKNKVILSLLSNSVKRQSLGCHHDLGPRDKGRLIIRVRDFGRQIFDHESLMCFQDAATVVISNSLNCVKVFPIRCLSYARVFPLKPGCTREIPADHLFFPVG